MTAAVPKGKGGVDRDALPRYPDGSQWWPPGLVRDVSDDQLAAALRGAWGTPRWVLDQALDVRELLGGPAAALGFDLDAGTRPGTHSWALSRRHLDGREQPFVHVEAPFEGARASWCALTRDWRGVAEVGVFDRPATVWCNFPFSGPKPWVERAIRAARDGCWVSVLAPHTTGSWWDDLEGSALATVRLRRVEFEPCPGLLDQHGRPAKGDKPSQQCSLVTLAPPDVAPPTRATVIPRLFTVGDKVQRRDFVVQPGPGLRARK